MGIIHLFDIVTMKFFILLLGIGIVSANPRYSDRYWYDPIVGTVNCENYIESEMVNNCDENLGMLCPVYDYYNGGCVFFRVCLAKVYSPPNKPDVKCRRTCPPKCADDEKWCVPERGEDECDKPDLCVKKTESCPQSGYLNGRK